jgi:hypothetical protein
VTTTTEQKAVEITLSNFEALLRAGDFAGVDELLECSPVDDDTPAEIVAVLSITFYGKDQLRERDAFVERARAFLTDKLGAERARALLENRT